MKQPRVIEISYGPFIHPAVIRNLPQKITIENERYITIFDQKFTPLNGETLEIGKQLFVQNGRFNMQASYVDEIKAYNEAKAERIKEKAEQKRIQKEKEIKEFWNQYDIPFDFSVEVKEVLSGLSENSMGNGLKKNSKHHIFVKEDIEFGRLKRHANSYLCSPSKAYSGGDWSGTLGNGRNGKHIITCKNCLTKIEKFKKQ